MTETRNIHQRLAAAMDDVKYIQKEDSSIGYKIVSHDKVTAKVRPALLNHGIVYYPVDLQHVNNGNRAEVLLTVRFVNIDDPADFFDVPSLGYGIDKQDKGPGKAISYAVKYALLKAMGLETGEDADHGDEDHESAERQRMDAIAEGFIRNIGNANNRESGNALWAQAPAEIRNRQDVQDALKSFANRFPKNAA